MPKFKLINIRRAQEFIHIRLHRKQFGILLGIIAVFVILGGFGNSIINGFTCSRYIVRESFHRTFTGITFGLRQADFGCKFGGLGTDNILVKYENAKEVSQKLLFISQRGESPQAVPLNHKWNSGSELEIFIYPNSHENLEDFEWNGLKIKFTQKERK
jgi:hypothetical protein